MGLLQSNEIEVAKFRKLRQADEIIWSNTKLSDQNKGRLYIHIHIYFVYFLSVFNCLKHTASISNVLLLDLSCGLGDEAWCLDYSFEGFLHIALIYF